MQPAALLVIDLQNDFMPGGTLPVPKADELVEVCNRLMAHPGFDFVAATQSWHPMTHVSFAQNHAGKHVGDAIDWQGRTLVLQPLHAVQGGHGAKLVHGLDTFRIHKSIKKGQNLDVDDYSAFWDAGRAKATGLAQELRDRHLSSVVVMGVATEYSVRNTVIDALAEGLRAILVEDACRGRDRRPGDVARAVDEMRAAGAEVVTLAQALAHDLAPA